MSDHDRIVAFVDTSQYAESVCDYAIWLAGKHDDLTLELVHVLDQPKRPETNMSGTIGLGARTNLLEKLAELDAERAKIAQAQGRAILEDASYRLTSTAPRITHNEILRTGGITEAVNTIGQGAQLIVIGKRGNTADVNSDLIGSNLETVIRASQTPVFVTNRAYARPKKFLIAYDGGASVDRAIDYMVRSNAFKGMSGELVSVGSEKSALNAKQKVAAAKLSDNGLPTETHWYENSNVEDTIVLAVSKHQSDLLVMGAYGHSRIRNWVIGSATSDMVRRCKIPILMVR